MKVPTSRFHPCGLLLCIPLFLAEACGRATDVTGAWEGLLHIYGVPDAQGKPEGKTFRIVVKIRNDGGQLAGTLASPDEGLGDVPAESVTFKDGSLRVDVPRMSEDYTGTIGANGTEFRGNLNQGTNAMPLILKRSAGL